MTASGVFVTCLWLKSTNMKCGLDVALGFPLTLWVWVQVEVVSLLP